MECPVQFEDGSARHPSTGWIRVGSPPAGLYNTVSVMTHETAANATPGTRSLISLTETNVNGSAVQIGDPSDTYSVLTGSCASIATDTLGGRPVGAYVLVRTDGLVGLQASRALGNPVFELSDNLIADYAVEFELAHAGTTRVHFNSTTTPVMDQEPAANGINGTPFTIRAQAGGAGDTDGGAVRLTCGAASGNGTPGSIDLTDPNGGLIAQATSNKWTLAKGARRHVRNVATLPATVDASDDHVHVRMNLAESGQLTLPAVHSEGDAYRVTMDANVDGATLTISGANGDTINGVPTLSLTSAFGGGVFTWTIDGWVKSN
jgi:hypothetical protein